jgi:hypothetical protein
MERGTAQGAGLGDTEPAGAGDAEADAPVLVDVAHGPDVPLPPGGPPVCPAAGAPPVWSAGGAPPPPPPPPAGLSCGPPRKPSDGKVAMNARMSLSWLSDRMLVEKHGIPCRPFRTTLATLSLAGLILKLPMGSWQAEQPNAAKASAPRAASHSLPLPVVAGHGATASRRASESWLNPTPTDSPGQARGRIPGVTRSRPRKSR